MSETTVTTPSKLALQMELEKLFNKNQLIPRLRQEFATSEMGFDQHMIENDIPVKFGMDLLVQISLHKRADIPTMVGVLYHHFNDAQLTADMLKRCAEVDLVDWDDVSEKFIVIYEVTDDVQEELDRYQFPLPMVVEPKPVTNNRQTGFLISGGSLIMNDNHHDEDICLDHINRMNSIKLTINAEVVAMVKNRWRNLDKPKNGESLDKFNERRQAFNKYDRVAHAVIDRLIEEGNVFHLTHEYDKRGRIYSKGYHVNYQGNPWNKAVLEFADKEIVPL